jgi:4'-phosphopantetheinyl transferase
MIAKSDVVIGNSSNLISRSQPPETLALAVRRVDIWKVSLEQTAMSDSDSCCLSADENARAKRFHFVSDRIRFAHCRVVLRALLARYLSIPANEILFDYTPTGKPEIAPEQNPRALRFNVSHSGEKALVAIGCQRRIGVDIERIRNNAETLALADRFFSERERSGLRAMPEHLRLPGFFACWTRKEAFPKAIGDGLSSPLSEFSVTTHPDLEPELEEIRGNREVRKQWFLGDLGVGDGYRSSIAVEGPRPDLRTYSWN